MSEPTKEPTQRNDKAVVKVSAYQSGDERCALVYIHPANGIGPVASISAQFGGSVNIAASDDVLMLCYLAIGEHLGVRA